MPGKKGRLFSVLKGVFRGSVELFYGAVVCVGAEISGDQLAVEDLFWGVVVKKTADGGKFRLRGGADLCDGLFGGSAAVVGNAVNDEGILPVGDGGGRVLPVFGVGVICPEGGDLASVRAFPSEEGGGKLNVPRLRPEEAVVVYAAFFEYLGQHWAVAEAVDVENAPGGFAEIFLQPPLAVKPLADIALSRGGIAVRLDPPALGKLPPPLGDPGAYLFKHCRVGVFDPFKHRGSGKRINKIRILVHPVQRRTEGGAYGGHSLVPAPEPDRIEMCVSYHIELLHGGITPVCSIFSMIPFLFRFCNRERREA